MSIRILIGDVRDRLAGIPADSVDCVVTSPPYWGLRDYGVVGQLGMESTLGEHLDVMVEVFDAVRRVMKPEATLWLNYGDCYATKPNGRSAAATKAAGSDDRTFRDKPFSTVGPIYGHLDTEYEKSPRAGKTQNFGNLGAQSGPQVVGVGVLKPKDLCMIPNRLAEGGTVLDPFFGAGTTGLVADRLQRNCIGIELNPEYAELARKRLLSDAGVFADISVEHAAPATRSAA